MSSQEYWKQREAEQLKHNIREEQAYQQHIDTIYQNMLDQIQKEIESFYAKYAAKEGISMAEAKKRAAKLDIYAYARKAKKYVKDKDFSDKANEEMRLYNLTMKVNRLELLKANIGLEMVSGFDALQQFLDQVLTHRTLAEFKRQAGILGKTVLNNREAVHAIVNASFHNATFSDRIWLYQDLLKKDLEKILSTGLIQGKNPRVLASDLQKRFGVSRHNAERLMVTELARVQIEAQKHSYERNGYQAYEFIALGSACPICKAKDGKHFQVRKMVPAENAPPMHPHCRCSTAAYEDSEEYEAWLDYLNKGGSTEEWNQLKKKGKPVAKTSGSGKISYNEAKRIKEAEDYARGLGIGTVSFKGADIVTANAMNRALANALNYCPKLADKIKFFGTTQEKNKLFKADLAKYYDKSLRAKYPRQSDTWYAQQSKRAASITVGKVSPRNWAEAYNGKVNSTDKDLIDICQKYAGISVNSKFAKDSVTFAQNIADSVKVKWHPQGCDTIESVFDHEFGHQLDYLLDIRSDKDIQKAWQAFKNLTPSDRRNTLSEYAYSDNKIAEFIAEGYAEYKNNPTPRKWAKIIGDWIESKVKKNE
nr:MAG TPA: minor capsid protein [Caudoviricetes sp.]